MANAIPIPQGAQIGEEQSAGIPIPSGAQIGGEPAEGTGHEATISAKPTGVGQWLRDLESDIRGGGGATLPGRVLQKMGAQGINVGAQAQGGETLTSPLTGAVHTAQGVAEIPQHPVSGTGHALGGLLEAATLPLSFMAPEAGELAAGAAGKATSKVVASKALKQAAGETGETIAKSVTPKLSEALHTVLDAVGQEHGAPTTVLPERLGVGGEASASKKAVAIADHIKTQAQSVYKELDELSGGRFQRFRDTIDDLKDVIRNKGHVDPDAVEKARTRLGVAEDAFEEVKKQLIAQGTDPATLRAADAKWAQAKSLEDFAKKLRQAESLSGDLKPGSASLDTGIKNLKPGRLERAVGEGGAGNVRESVIQAGKEIESKKAAVAKAKTELDAVRKRQKALGIVGGSALLGAGISKGKDALSHVLSGH